MSFVYKQAKTKPCICTWLYIPRNSERIYKHDNSNYLDRQKKHLLNDSYKKKKKNCCFSYDIGKQETWRVLSEY